MRLFILLILSLLSTSALAHNWTCEQPSYDKAKQSQEEAEASFDEALESANTVKRVLRIWRDVSPQRVYQSHMRLVEQINSSPEVYKTTSERLVNLPRVAHQAREVNNDIRIARVHLFLAEQLWLKMAKICDEVNFEAIVETSMKNVTALRNQDKQLDILSKILKENISNANEDIVFMRQAMALSARADDFNWRSIPFSHR